MKKTNDLIIDREYLHELAQGTAPDTAELDTILSHAMQLKGISVEEAAKLLSVTDRTGLGKIKRAASEIKDLIYGRRLVLFAPIYTSNECSNNCLYCSFRIDNKSIPRVSLTPPQVAAEAKKLVDMGHKRVLLIGGETKKYGADYYIECMREVYKVKSGRGSIRRINVEIAPLSVEDFAKLKAEKLGTYICFQETYDEILYEKVHPSGIKRDYRWRLEVMDRAMQAGLGDVGIGALFGLGDYKFEALAMLRHAAHLESTYGAGPHTVSVPRIEPAEGAELSTHIPSPVDDDSFIKLVSVIRISLPYTGIILSTRETAEMRNHLFNYGVSQISGGSRTSPGGYSDAEDRDAGAQFTLGDHRTLEEVITSLVDGGYIPSFCTGCYRKGRVGADFMELAKPGLIHQFCQPNGLFTFTEYLEDYASPELKARGSALCDKLAHSIDHENTRAITLDAIARIRAGERDIYL